MKETFHTPYPGYDVLEKRDTPSWNEQTREAVSQRLHEVPERRFLTADEWRLLGALADRVLPQPDRPHDPVPIVPWIDGMLERNQGNGYRYDGVPPLREAWRRGLASIDEESRARHGRRFADLTPEEQDALLGRIQRGEADGDASGRFTPSWFFTNMLVREIAGVYYAHPAAWSEIGFGGPASPRGYVRLGFDQRDPWEAEEKP